MRKFTVILLALVLMLSMTACAGLIPTATQGKTEPPKTTAAPTTPSTTEPPATTIPATTPPTTVPATEPQIADNYYVGQTVNNVYTNEFLGISCQLDDSWMVYNEEQLAQLAGLTADILDNEKFEQAIEQGVVITAFYAQGQGGAANMNLTLERLSLINGILMDEESYVELAKDQLKTALETAGCINVSVEPAKFQFADAERHGAKVYANLQGVDVYENIICIKNGNYMACVVVCSAGTDTTESMMAMFRKLPE